MKKPPLTCPLCFAPAMTAKEAVNLSTQNVVYYYVCDDCPAILLEYVHKGDAHLMADSIEYTMDEECARKNYLSQ